MSSVPGTLIFASKSLTAQGNKKKKKNAEWRERTQGESPGEAREEERLQTVTG